MTRCLGKVSKLGPGFLAEHKLVATQRILLSHCYPGEPSVCRPPYKHCFSRSELRVTRGEVSDLRTLCYSSGQIYKGLWCLLPPPTRGNLCPETAISPSKGLTVYMQTEKFINDLKKRRRGKKAGKRKRNRSRFSILH